MTNRRRIYDTRFFATLYYSKDEDEIRRIKLELMGSHTKSISAITIYEIYKLTLQTDGKDVSDLRVRLLEKDFKVINVDPRISREAALIWHKYRLPMADAIIVATGIIFKAECVTNDPHFTSISEITTRWI